MSANKKIGKFSVLIVDDEPLARERIRDLLALDSEIDLIKEAKNGLEAVEIISEQIPDIIFLDIQMPHLTGFQVLETLGREICGKIPVIIFVTAYDEYALKAFEFYALDYLLKPFPRDRFQEAVRRAKLLRQNNTPETSEKILSLISELGEKDEKLKWFTVKKNDRILPYRSEDILWVEANQNYAALRFADNTEMIRETMEKLEKQLDPNSFIRINRSTIININFVKEIQVWFQNEYRIMMKNGKDFVLTASYREKFMKFFKRNF